MVNYWSKHWKSHAHLTANRGSITAKRFLETKLAITATGMAYFIEMCLQPTSVWTL